MLEIKIRYPIRAPVIEFSSNPFAFDYGSGLSPHLEAVHPSKKVGNELPIVLPQVTPNKVSSVTQNDKLSVFVGNEHGIPLAAGWSASPFVGESKEDGEAIRFQQWSGR